MDSVIGIDVGTGSVRGCAFDLNGDQISEPEGNSQIIFSINHLKIGTFL